MTRESIATVLKALGVTFLWGLILFADGIWNSSSGFLGTITREVTAACRDSQTQWMVVLCLASYFVLLLFLERRFKNSTPHPPSPSSGATSPSLSMNWSAGLRPGTNLPVHRNEPGRRPALQSGSGAFSGHLAFFRGCIFNPNLWLGALVVLALVRYACNYKAATHSLQLLVLLAGIVFGKGALVWVAASSETRHLTPALSPIDPPSSDFGATSAERVSAQRMSGIVIVLIALLAASALWQQEMGREYQYRGVLRWSGVWNNPNIFGLLMGVGIILAVGQFMSLATRHPSHLLNGEHPTSNIQHPTSNIQHPISESEDVQ